MVKRGKGRKARARRHERPMSVLMIDLDGFRDYGDTNGRPAGDEAPSVVIHMERRTVGYYGKLHEGCIYPTGRRAFAQIIEEEERHAARLEEAKNAGGGG